jgi:hypothetical protein
MANYKLAEKPSRYWWAAPWRGGKKTPIGTAHTAINQWGLPKLNWVNTMLTTLVHSCKPDANKKAGPKLHRVL